MENPLTIKVYTKDFEFVGFVVDPIYAHFVPSWLHQGYGNFMLDAAHPYTAELQADGARITVEYKGQMVISGPLQSWRGDIDDAGTATYQMLSDERLLENVLLFPNPRNPLAPASLAVHGQAWNLDAPNWEPGTVTGLYSYFPWPDGSSAWGGENIVSAEAAIKYAIRTQMIERLGLPLNLLPNRNRGGDVRDVLPKVKMVPLLEVMTPILAASPDLSIRFWQEPQGAQINVDVRESGEWIQPLSLEAGTVVEGAYSRRVPTVTRAIVAGPGETAGRMYYGTQGRGRTDLEKQFGDVVEVLREAGGMSDLTWPTGLADKYKVPKYYPFRAEGKHVARFYRELEAEKVRGETAGRVTSGLSLTLAESPGGISMFGDEGMQLGDKVTIDIRGVDFTDRISEAMLTFSRDEGFRVTPVVGDREDDPDVRLARSVSNLYRALRRQTADK